MKILITCIVLVLFFLILLYVNLKSQKRNLYIVTVVTDINNKNYIRLLNSANLNGIKIIPLISNKPIGHIQGFGMKIKLINDFITDKNDDDIVMFVDGYDVLLTGTQNEILKRYETFESQVGKCIIFSAESVCWPDSTLAERYPKFNATPYKYLNSGTYIGSIGILKNILSKSIKNIDEHEFEKIDDQLFYTNLYLTNHEKKIIILDHYNTIFNCMSGQVTDIEYNQNEKKWYNKQTQSYPLVFHGNGDSIKFLIEKIYPTI